MPARVRRRVACRRCPRDHSLSGGNDADSIPGILGALAIGVCGAIAYLVVPARVTEEDALASLSHPDLSERYTGAFWERERGAKTPLWGRALSVCQQLGRRAEPRPNCQVVVLVAGASAQEELAREQLAERRRIEKWIESGTAAEIGDGLTGKGAKAGGLPTLKPEAP